MAGRSAENGAAEAAFTVQSITFGQMRASAVG